MTDKQIVIDGVDVTKCPSYMDFKKCTMLSYVSACEGSCAYTEFHNLLVENEEIKEQLKRKEQECERLKEEVSLLKESNSKLQQMEDSKSIEKFYLQQLDQLKAENDELKRCYKNNSTLLDFEETNTTKLVNKIMKLEKTLAEVKEIVTKMEYGNDFDYDFTWGEQILQKISEVIPDEN